MNAQTDPPNAGPRCPHCDIMLDPAAPDGLCPRCLLQLARDFADPDAAGLDPLSPLTLGEFADFELLAEIGHGGMGVVYQARQKSLGRVVALKMLLGGQFAEPQARARFRSEAEIAAQLQHPNIVAIHEVGEHDHLPFFTMDYVEGRSLAEVARDKPLTPAAAAGYMAIIARAIGYAHEHGVLHRDLKPSNILIDGSDQPRITDFGLAKRLTGSTTSLTLSGEALGSPNFMPPEQAAGKHKEIGPPSDVYGLGAILYYLVTSRPPFIADNLTAAVRQVQDQEPVSPRMLNPGVPKDLETICLKCLQKEPSKRYATAGELADELDRFRRGEPIQARPVGPAGRAWRWCRRRPALAAALVAVMILAGVSTTAAVRMALAQEGRERERYRANIQLAAARIEEGSIDVALETLLDCPERFRHWEWGYLVAQCHREVLTLEEANTKLLVSTLEPEWRCAFSTDGTRVGTVHPGGIVQVWERASGKPVWSFRESVDPGIGILWLPDWTGVVLARSNVVEVIRMGRPDSRLQLEGHTFPVRRLALTADGQRVAAVAADDTARIWDAISGNELVVFSTIPDCQRLFFTPDGDGLVVGARKEAAVYGAHTGQEIARMAGAQGKMFGVQPDAQAEHYVTIALTDHFLCYRFCLWTTNGMVRDLGETEQRTHQTVAFSPDGSLLCMSGNLARASVHDMASGEVVFPIPVKVNSAAFSPDAKRLATVGGSSTISIWEVAERQELLQLKGHSNPVNDVAFSPDGRLLVSVDAEGTVKIWSALTGREILDHPSLVWGVSHTPDGRKVATAPLPDGVAIWDTRSGQQLAHLRRLNRVSHCVAFSPDGEHLAAGDVFGDIAIWSAGTGELVHLLNAHDFAVFVEIRYSPDGRLLASAGWDGKIRIWDPATGAPLRTLNPQSTWVRSMDFSPNSRRLAVTETNLVRIWNIETGQCERELRGHSDEVQGVRFSPDGAHLVSTSADATLRLWDVRSGRTLSVCRLRGKLAMGLALSPDGRRVALRVCQSDGAFSAPPTVEIWDVQSGHQLLVFRGNVEIGWFAEFSSTGLTLVTDWWDFKLRQWEAFPWTDAAYARSGAGTLRERMRVYADQYWRERTLAEADAGGTNAMLYVDLPFDRSSIPSRAAAAPPELLDLTAFYTSSLDRCSYLDPIVDDSQLDFRNAPKGLTVFQGTPFDMRGIIQLTLASKDTLWERFATSVEAIPVNRPCHRLHGLIGSIGRAAEGEPIGALVLHYADDQKHELEMVYGQHVRHWRTDGDARADTDLAQLAWQGSHAFWLYPDTRLRIYHAVWDNPRPELEIVSFDFVSKMTTTAAPFLIAVTVE